MLKRFVNSSLVLTVSTVEVIFDAVVRAPGQFFCDVSPLVSELLM